MKNRNRWELPVISVVCTVGGLFLGGLVRTDAPDQAQQIDEEHPSHAAGLSPATLRNMGVEVGPVETTDFIETMTVAALVVDTPMTERPVFAPIGGRIVEIVDRLGAVVQPGDAIALLTRDAIPRPELRMTGGILVPAVEDLHASVSLLRTSREELRIVDEELARIAEFTTSSDEGVAPVIPRQRSIDLRYDRARATKALEQARADLRKHGLSEEQVEEVADGGSLPTIDETLWRRALSENGFWPEAAEDLAAVLPSDLLALPWVIATVAELAVSGLVSSDLVSWLGDDPEVAAHFLDIGSLRLRGHSVPELRQLHEQNAFEPVVEVAAPSLAEGAAWDVVEIFVKPGSFVEAGETLATVRDPRVLMLRSEPVGGEVVAVLAAARERFPVSATPFVPGSGPELTDLTIDYVESSQENHGTTAVLSVENEVASEIATDGGASARTWSLREGLRYQLEVPVGQMEGVFVLPASAVTQVGPDTVVFLQDGETFRALPIVVAYQDHRVVVVPQSAECELFPGDMIALSGAFELSLATQTSDAPDAHAGHNH